MAGRLSRLDDVPVPFPREVPFVEGVWQDGEAVTLAAWAVGLTQLQQRAYGLRFLVDHARAEALHDCHCLEAVARRLPNSTAGAT